jgi:acetate kinase
MATVRASVCAGLTYLGALLDRATNDTAVADATIHTNDSSVGIYIIRTLEEWAVAENAVRVLRKIPV